MILKSIILGLIQGFTEFLPVSSSGHLVVFERLFNFTFPGALFETVLHMGTTVAVLIYYRKKLMNITLYEIKLLIIGTIPAVVIGLLFKDPIEALFSSTKIVGFALIVTGIINFYIDKKDGKKENLDIIDSIVIGLAQAVAIIPGITRSGSTILAARSSKIDAEKAAEFSFLLSIPAVVGANVLQLATHGFDANQELSIFIAGFFASLVSGYFAIRLVINLLKQKQFKVFGAYCIIFGLAVILLL